MPHIFAASSIALFLLVLVVVPTKPVEAKRTTLSLELELSPSQVPAKTLTLDKIKASDSNISSFINTKEQTKAPVSVATPTLEIAPEVITSLSGPEWQYFTVRKGDTLSDLFERAEVSAKQMFNMLGSNKATKSLERIYPGHQLAFLVDGNSQLIGLKHALNRLETHQYMRDENGKFALEKQLLEPEIQISYRTATIDSSLFLASQKVGLSTNLTMELATIFGWDIDFVLDIRSGDTFSVVFEELYLEGEKLKDGNILAARFVNQGRVVEAVMYEDTSGINHYYSPEGKSMRKAFLRSPVEFARISSHFNLKRRHPVLHTIRAHKGTDYAAARGTPIRATGDGKVTFAGRKGGYGNVVILQHGQKYETRYAHMTKFAKGVRSGKRVRQGQVIGYVGSTGLASGPHLHYEFRMNGAVRNPVTVKLPVAEPVPSKEKQRFMAQTQSRMAALTQYLQARTEQPVKQPQS